MLLFIDTSWLYCSPLMAFQNISCYCLSGIVWRYSRRVNYFKTSHVIVYHHYHLDTQDICVYFKTSHVIVYRGLYTAVNIPIRFQNISCYCLSYGAWKEWIKQIDFKTSHVIVYPFVVSVLIYPTLYFKTSHVIVYPSHFRVFSFSPPLFPLIFSIFLHFLPANTLILDRTTYHPINLLIFQAFLDFSFFFRLVKIL